MIHAQKTQKKCKKVIETKNGQKIFQIRRNGKQLEKPGQSHCQVSWNIEILKYWNIELCENDLFQIYVRL